MIARFDTKGDISDSHISNVLVTYVLGKAKLHLVRHPTKGRYCYTWNFNCFDGKNGVSTNIDEKAANKFIEAWNKAYNG